MTDFSRIGVAVIGTGFIGTVHVWALRRLGVDLRGVLGSSPERGAKAAAGLGVASFDTLEQLCADESVQAVHVTSPNHLHYPQVKALIEAGKHVVCEKPLTMTAAQSAELVALAEASGLVCAVCYNIRFYPLNQQARGMVAAGELGDLRLITGHYVQDWLAKPTDWNWRLEGDKGGDLRAVGDIGTHWADLTSFVAGEKPVAVLAELSTFLKQRDKPTGPVETFTAASGATEKVTVTTEDTALILLRYPSGARGSLTVSQVSPGRKNSLRWDIAGSTASAEWNSETPDHLFIGHRDGPNQILQRDAALMNATGAAAAHLPGGHVEGFADTFFALFSQVYSDVLAGGRQEASTWASFADGHFEMEFCEAVLASAQSGAWVKIGG
ncbi:Gfo/Idh/MocA family oxidoreductase [Oceanicola sp. D3]|uniref:Gfo/Idh/MocA family protein n=1 Tax=Oceanicola sp. D3 TaxID=2587163 RepID=UPI00111DD7D0|nr:Gfo/Idh/MocA family oxidoreductase [Oceanicola sp. D3]QDC10008.1 Gfo/Idh/MocA family oxidoreductase [Oceanicola sp. D3]